MATGRRRPSTVPQSFPAVRPHHRRPKVPVTESCSPNGQGVELDPTTNQRLRYTIETDGSVLYTLRGGAATLLPNGGSSKQSRLWPASSGEMPPGAEARHGLAMQFGGKGTLRWKIELLDDDDTVLEVVRDCTFSNEGGPEDHMIAFRIFLVR